MQDPPNSQKLHTPVTYCGVCGLPPEYCCYGNTYADCREWILKNFDFGEYQKFGTKESLLEDWDNTFEIENKLKQKILDSQNENTESNASTSSSTNVVIIVNNRGKRRFVTEIHGLPADTEDACKKIKKKFACSAKVTGTTMKERKGERNAKKQQKRKQRDIEMQNRKNRKNKMPEIEPEQVVVEHSKKKTTPDEEFIEAQGDLSENLPKFIHEQFGISLDNITIKKK